MSEQSDENVHILLVDDEINILSGYKRALRKEFNIITAASGQIALQTLASNSAIQLVVSDMRMPEMDGLELLEKIKSEYPDIVRVMLTGNADKQTAINAINKGEIFRFLTKPCAPDLLSKTISEGIEQYRLKMLEHDLLKNTLRGSIKALTEVLSLVNPEAFGRTMRITNLTVAIARAIGMKNVWFLESLAMLSQLGCVILPQDLLNDVYEGRTLSEEQKQLFDMHPSMGANIIGKIPRMESTAKSILYQMKNYDGSGSPVDEVKGAEIPAGARILRPVIDFDNYLAGGMSEQQGFEKLMQNRQLYDPNVLKSLRKVLSAQDAIEIHKIPLAKLRVGMKIMEDIRARDGLLIINKGHEVSETLIEHLRIFSRQRNISEPIHVTLIDDEALEPR